jgi:hypothetical protein
MAIYPPPSESPPVFNELDFIQIISTKFLDKNYLRLIAQSDENMNGNGITNMKAGDPAITTLSNAASMDDVAAAGGGSFLKLLPGTEGMAGDLPMVISGGGLPLRKKVTLMADGTLNSDAANVGQMNTAIATAIGAIPLPYLPLAGGTMSGDIDMGTDNLLMDDTAVSLGSITGDILGSGLGIATLVVDGNNTSFGTAQFTTTALTGPVDVNSFTGNQLRINGQYKFYLRNTSGQTITFKGNSTASWTGGMKCGTVADLVVTNAREAVVEVDVWSATFSVVRFYSIR